MLNHSLTTFFIAGLLQKSKGRPSRKEGGVQSLDFSTRRTMGVQLPLGDWTSTGYSMCLMCAQSFSAWLSSLTAHFKTELSVNTHTQLFLTFAMTS